MIAENPGNGDREQDQEPPQSTVDERLTEAKGPLERVPLDAEQRVRVAEARVVEVETAVSQAKDDRELRKTIANTVIKAVFIQVGIADVTFLVYGFWTGWDIPGSTMNAWLAATVVQVIAVALVVTRSLFPKRDKS